MFYLASVSPLWIPIASFIFVLGIFALIVGSSLVETILKTRRKREILRYHHEQSLVAYEKGLTPPELPAEVLKDLNSTKKHKRMGDSYGNLFWSIVLLIAAAGILFYNGGLEYIRRNEDSLLFFVVFFALGVGNLVLFFVRRKQGKNIQEDVKTTEEND